MSDAPSTVPVVISAAGVKKAQVDFVAEMFAFLDTRRKFGDLELLPPTLGVFALWELADVKFFHDPWGCSFSELGRALWICQERQNAAQAVERLVYADDAAAIDRGAEQVLTAGGEELLRELPELITYIHTAPWEGFRMIPSEGTEEEPTQFLFDGAKLGMLCAMGAEAGASPNQILWEMPLTQLGHFVAAIAKRAGKEGIERPYDHEDVVSRMKAAVNTGDNLYNG